MASVSQFLCTKLRLRVNESKSAVARPQERACLGFRITNDRRRREVAPKALARFKVRIQKLTLRTRRVRLEAVVESLSRYLVGWRGYFGFCETPRVLASLDAHIRRRLRMHLWRQWRTGRNRFRQLRARGISMFQAAVAAESPTGLWRMSGHPAVQYALRNAYFDSVGLPRRDSARLTSSNRRGT
jgi:RNA-directed DNA polymerase